MFLLIDNYDSFTYNLVHLLYALGAEVTIRRNREVTPAEVLALQPDGILLSPGSSSPDRAGILCDLVRAGAEARVPMFGVCLGHQAIGQVFGARVVHATTASRRTVSVSPSAKTTRVVRERVAVTTHAPRKVVTHSAKRKLIGINRWSAAPVRALAGATKTFSETTQRGSGQSRRVRKGRSAEAQ